METITKNEVNIRSLAIKNGLIWGAISVVVFLAMYYISVDMMASYFGTTISLLISLGLAIFFCLDMRKQIGGYWSFKEALLNIFIMFLISVAISYAFTILFGKYIEPGYPVAMKEKIMAKTESVFKSVGIDDSKLSEQMDELSENLDKQLNPTFAQAVRGFGITAIMYFIGALIFAAIFKKERPITFVSQEPEF
jgi:hypothetical protein